MGIHVYDSLLQKDYPDHRVYAVTYEPVWQTIRMQCSFRGFDDVRIAIAHCEAYIGMSEDAYETQCRLWRVWNLFRAIPHGQSLKYSGGINVISREATTSAVTYELAVKGRIKGPLSHWDWDVSRQALLQMKPEALVSIWDRLSKDRGNAYRARTLTSTPKRELTHFLEMLEEVADAIDQ
jgi:hypothetical protein